VTSLQRIAMVAWAAGLALLPATTANARAPIDVPAAALTKVDVPGTTAQGAAVPAELSRARYVEREY
jgi:hypothetical protein